MAYGGIKYKIENLQPSVCEAHLNLKRDFSLELCCMMLDFTKYGDSGTEFDPYHDQYVHEL